jgi:hypothetical protein
MFTVESRKKISFDPICREQENFFKSLSDSKKKSILHIEMKNMINGESTQWVK